MSSSPDDLTTVTVTGQYYLSNGEPAEGSVAFEPSTQLAHRAGAYLIAPAPQVVYLDGLGGISVRLYATDNADLLPIGWYWKVTQQINGTQIQWNLQLPGSLGSADIALLASQ